MKTDNIFYKLFVKLPRAFFEIIGQPPELAKDYRFKSVAVKEVEKTMDGILSPIDENSDKTIYFIEVQFQKDNKFYWRLMTEVMVYIGQYEIKQNWLAVVLWEKRSLDPGVPESYRNFLQTRNLKQVYLDELDPSSLALGIVKLVVEREDNTKSQVSRLIQAARSEVTDESLRRDIIELIEKVVVYKFPSKTSKELEEMFGLSEWKKTKFYQEAYADGAIESKLESVPGFLKLGLTVEQIARALKLDIETVRQVANGKSSK